MSNSKKKIKTISKLQIQIVKFLLFLGKSFIGRGQLRKLMIVLINYLIGYGSLKKSRFVCNVNNVPFNFYNDKLTFIKIYFGRSNIDEIDFIQKKIVKINQNLIWDINKIEIYNDLNTKEKILNFQQSNKILFSIIKNNDLYLTKKAFDTQNFPYWSFLHAADMFGY